MEKIATHSGIVIASEAPVSGKIGCVTVRMKVSSACSSCQAHAHCSFAESAEKDVVVDTPEWAEYSVGDSVHVIISQSNGMTAVLLAYILPAILLIAVFVLLHSLWGELWAALGTLLFVALYWGLLWCFRTKLQKRFSFHLTKLPLPN